MGIDNDDTENKLHRNYVVIKWRFPIYVPQSFFMGDVHC